VTTKLKTQAHKTPARKGAKDTTTSGEAYSPALTAEQQITQLLEDGDAASKGGVPLALLMDANYRRYAVEVVLNRAIPDARDGLKPVHRRILYDMLIELGLDSKGPHKKSARVVGDTLGKFHPHGDSSVYGAMVILAQDFSMRLPLVDGQGNWGSQDGDGPAAMRYTEARVAPAGEALLADIKADTVDFEPNFDGSLQEPVVLPSRIPNLLINGSSGIAVGMATSIPPHNVGEVCDAVVYLAQNWARRAKVGVDDLMRFIPGPDYPTGGMVFRYRPDKETGQPVDMLRQAYETGKAILVLQATTDIQEIGGGKSEIVVTEIPYQVSRATIKDRVADKREEFRAAGVANVSDQSDRKGMRLVFETVRGADPQAVLAYLLDKTQLRDSQSFNAVAIIRTEGGGETPKQCNLKEMLEQFVAFRLDVIVRRCRFELKRAEDRLHIILGLLKAIDAIDEVIRIIRGAADTDDARIKLMKRLDIDEIQANAILDMQLKRLVKLERRKLDDERKELEARIKNLKAILGSEAKQLEIVVEETKEVKTRFATPRRTRIVEAEEGHKTVVTGAAGPEEPQMILVTDDGLQMVDAAKYRAPVSGKVSAKATDIVLQRLPAQPGDTVILVSSRGRLWKGGVERLPGEARFTDFGLERNERVIGCGLAQADRFLVIGTRGGIVKRVKVEDLGSRSDGTWGTVIGLAEGDEALFASVVSDAAQVLFVTRGGSGDARVLRFLANVLTPQATPSAKGVMGIRVKDGDQIVAGVSFESGEGQDERRIVLVAGKGQAKSMSIVEFPVQGRGGQGVSALKPTDKTGLVTGIALVDADGSLAIYSGKGRRLRLAVKDLPTSARSSNKCANLAKYGEDKVLFDGEEVAWVAAD